MTLFDDLRKISNTPLIPGVPNSKVFDPLGIGSYLGISNPFGGISEVSKYIPYLIIGGGTLVLIFVLKK